MSALVFGDRTSLPCTRSEDQSAVNDAKQVSRFTKSALQEKETLQDVKDQINETISDATLELKEVEERISAIAYMLEAHKQTFETLYQNKSAHSQGARWEWDSKELIFTVLTDCEERAPHEFGSTAEAMEDALKSEKQSLEETMNQEAAEGRIARPYMDQTNVLTDFCNQRQSELEIEAKVIQIRRNEAMVMLQEIEKEEAGGLQPDRK